jgi:hypothetical protein
MTKMSTKMSTKRADYEAILAHWLAWKENPTEKAPTSLATLADVLAYLDYYRGATDAPTLDPGLSTEAFLDFLDWE